MGGTMKSKLVAVNATALAVYESIIITTPEPESKLDPFIEIFYPFLYVGFSDGVPMLGVSASL